MLTFKFLKFSSQILFPFSCVLFDYILLVAGKDNYNCELIMETSQGLYLSVHLKIGTYPILVLAFLTAKNNFMNFLKFAKDVNNHLHTIFHYRYLLPLAPIPSINKIKKIPFRNLFWPYLGSIASKLQNLVPTPQSIPIPIWGQGQEFGSLDTVKPRYCKNYILQIRFFSFLNTLNKHLFH